MKLSTVLVVLPIVVILTAIYTPIVWVNLAMLVDFHTPWVLFESKWYAAYHEFLISRRSEVAEQSLLEVKLEDANFEHIRKVSNGFTVPFVIRGMLKDSEGVREWESAEWWLSRYADETVLCGTLSEVVEDCTIKYFFDQLTKGTPFYISGASNIFDKNPELHTMIDAPEIVAMEPGTRTATQIFMGVPDMGSDIHCAIGINIFRQITGRKKWWFIPPKETPYLIPSINVNGFSAHTQTLVGKGGKQPSPWLTKLERYTAILEPGDVLFNPPWYWHGILNLGNITANDLIIGAPSRYGRGFTNKAAFRSNPVFTLVAYLTLLKNYGLKALKPDFKINLQQDIANNRRDREKKYFVFEEHPFDEAD